MSKIARVKFIRDKEPNIKALTASSRVLDGALYVATDTGTMWMGTSATSLIQIKDNINTNTTYTLTKSGSTITLSGSDGSSVNITDSNTVYSNATTGAAGLMSAADKAKLDGVAAGANHVAVDAELSATSTNPVQNKVIKSALDGKSNTDHTHDDRYYTESEINSKLSGKQDKMNFAAVATSGSYNDLVNKPAIPTIPGSLKNPNALTISLNGASQGAYDGSTVKNINITASSVGAAPSSHTHSKSQITDFPASMPASDVYPWAKQSSKPSYTIGEVGGSLDAARISGTISAANLPSYVDDVLEFASFSRFPTTGESGKIYTALDTNKIYRWSGSSYVVISDTIALGTTHSTAGYGDESRAAYNHSTSTGNPHHTTKADVGLGNVDNTADSAKSVRYATNAGSADSVAWSNVSNKPASMPASDVHSWAKQPNKPSYTAGEVGAAPASHSHPYLPLSGGTMTGRISRGSGGSWISARNNVIAFGTVSNSGSYNPVVGQKTSNGAWTVGNLAGDERLVFSYDTDTNFNAGRNSSNTTYLPIGNSSQEIITSTTIGSQSVHYANSAGYANSTGSVAWSNVSGRPSSMPASDVYAWAKASSKPSYSWSEISNRPSIPSVGNGTVTITQNGATKGTFTLNQSGNATIALTDTNTDTWRPEEVIVSSSQPSANTCKLWIKI